MTRSRKRELISRCYNRLLRLALRARFSDAQCGFKAIRADVARGAAARSSRTRRGSSTPSCSCSRSAAACGSTRCRSTGSRTRDSRVDIVPTALADLRGVVRLLVHRSPAPRPERCPRPADRCSRRELGLAIRPSRVGARPRRAPARAPASLLAYPELLALLALTAVLNLWDLSINGWANTYYAAAVRSMSTSWHDFLFASLDKTGLMTVDKPPLAFWVQALSVRVFGFHPLSILVPEALMGVAAVGARVRHDAPDVRPRRRRASAGLAFALTPITVAIARHNNPDELLILCCVAALWCAVRALETGRTKWLVLMRRRASASGSRRRWAWRCSSCPGSRSPGCGAAGARPGARA